MKSPGGALSPALQELLSTLHAVHDGREQFRGILEQVGEGKWGGDALPSLEPVVHPVVRVHPEGAGQERAQRRYRRRAGRVVPRHQRYVGRVHAVVHPPEAEWVEDLVREYVADVQKRFAGVQKDVQARFSDFELEPKALREQATTVVNQRVDALTKDAKARRAAVEARIEELQKALNENVSSVGDTYADLAKRGETLVERIRNQQSTKATVKSAKTTSAKAKTTKTQASKATKTTAKKTAKKASTTAKKSSTAPKSSAKATATAAKKTATNAAFAATDAAEKVGD